MIKGLFFIQQIAANVEHTTSYQRYGISLQTAGAWLYPIAGNLERVGIQIWLMWRSLEHPDGRC